MRILLTGAAGFIGSQLAERLLGRGDEVVGLDNFNEFYDPAIKRRHAALLDEHPGFTLVEGDIRDAGIVARLFREGEFDGVIHLAAMAGVRSSLRDPLHYTDVNIRGTQILLSQLVDRPAKTRGRGDR